ncbi:MAG: ATP-dependent DNA helicase RecG [Coxiellaceae bacterium]|nr:ATP-dependent DNA helicase RecG [Coxiellaceae bacterium]|tara:strand:+ start:2998 stop:5112 length:2115 start_codon:yes stop_codon:yes gene_type:complete
MSTKSYKAIQPSLVKVPVTQLKGIGIKSAAKLHDLGIYSIQDLLFHLPLRYEDRTVIIPIERVVVGERCLIAGEIENSAITGGARRFLRCKLKDDTGVITLRFFHFNRSQLQTFQQPGIKICCFGEVRSTQYGLEMVHPEYRIIDNAGELMSNSSMTPVYPTLQGLKQSLWRRLMSQAMSYLQQANYHLQEGLPEKIISHYQLPSLHDALCYLHSPTYPLSTDKGRSELFFMKKRLIFEELLTHQFSLMRLRSVIQSKPACMIDCLDLQHRLISNLSFELTSAQKRVVFEINDDLRKGEPMLRLVQGDVGCGKTIVAALAALAVIDAGYQVAIMAPTELLAEQHYQQFKRWLQPMNVSVGWLPGKLPSKIKAETLSHIRSGDLSLVVGTHALIQDNVEFNALALVIIDEQHRFGVYQRLSLKSKGESSDMLPHQLIMTATPIPRSLAMSAYGDLDCSIIDELPPGRKPIETVMIEQSKREQVIARVRENCSTGCQAYWVCTLVEESEVLHCQAAESTAEQLQLCMPDLSIGLIHGRLSSAEKESMMHAFASGEVDVLVATTVVEVGVDVPNASLMIIENPERLGLAQLHQLRGRVGRGLSASFCVLLYQSPLSKNAQSRLQVIRESSDGFYIAQQDLILRGPGELLGARQAGLARYRVADMLRDEDLIFEVQRIAQTLYKEMSANNVEMLVQRWLGITEKVIQV